jgi:NADH-quinone oxidoreductase subunit F
MNIANNIPGGRTICAFGEACSWPVQSFVTKFKDEFVAKGAAAEEAAKSKVAPMRSDPMVDVNVAAS